MQKLSRKELRDPGLKYSSSTHYIVWSYMFKCALLQEGDKNTSFIKLFRDQHHVSLPQCTIHSVIKM